jgi:hypothetical protein
MHLCNIVHILSEFLTCNNQEMVSILTNYSALLFSGVVSIATGCAVLTGCDDTITVSVNNFIPAYCSVRSIFPLIKVSVVASIARTRPEMATRTQTQGFWVRITLRHGSLLLFCI